MKYKYKIGDKIIITEESTFFDRGVITTISDIQDRGDDDPLYITTHSQEWGVFQSNFKLAGINWKKRLRGIKCQN